MPRYLRVRSSDGAIVGECEMSAALALRNSPPGEVLMPRPEGVGPRTHRWTYQGFVPLDPDPEPQPWERYDYLRRTGYPPAGEQLGAILKVLADPGDPAARAELDAVLDAIAAIKAAHPKPTD